MFSKILAITLQLLLIYALSYLGIPAYLLGVVIGLMGSASLLCKNQQGKIREKSALALSFLIATLFYFLISGQAYGIYIGAAVFLAAGFGLTRLYKEKPDYRLWLYEALPSVFRFMVFERVSGAFSGLGGKVNISGLAMPVRYIEALCLLIAFCVCQHMIQKYINSGEQGAYGQREKVEEQHRGLKGFLKFAAVTTLIICWFNPANLLMIDNIKNSVLDTLMNDGSTKIAKKVTIKGTLKDDGSDEIIISNTGDTTQQYTIKSQVPVMLTVTKEDGAAVLSLPVFDEQSFDIYPTGADERYTLSMQAAGGGAGSIFSDDPASYKLTVKQLNTDLRVENGDPIFNMLGKIEASYNSGNATRFIALYRFDELSELLHDSLYQDLAAISQTYADIVDASVSSNAFSIYAQLALVYYRIYNDIFGDLSNNFSELGALNNIVSDNCDKTAIAFILYGLQGNPDNREQNFTASMFRLEGSTLKLRYVGSAVEGKKTFIRANAVITKDGTVIANDDITLVLEHFGNQQTVYTIYDKYSGNGQWVSNLFSSIGQYFTDGNYLGLNLGYDGNIPSMADQDPSNKNQFENRYEINNTIMTYAEAEAYSASLGGHLAVIDSDEEQEYVDALIQYYGYQDHYMLGGGGGGSGGSVIEYEKAGIAAQSDYSFKVNGELYNAHGETYNFDAFLIKRKGIQVFEHFVKLRDLAYVLNGETAQFSVKPDDKTGYLNLENGKPYTPNGGELKKENLGEANYEQSRDVFTLNGYRFTTTPFKINGNNYFRIKDLAGVFGFEVNIDESQKTVEIKTFTSNTPDTLADIKGKTHEDTDGDGIPDKWERDGVPLGNGKFIDLKEMGADPNIPDVFVEVDWMVEDSPAYENGKKSYGPEGNSLNQVAKVFKEHGIQLHIDAGPNSIDYVTGKKWDDYSDGSGGKELNYHPIVSIGGNAENNWEVISENFSSHRKEIFHYCIFVNQYSEDLDSSGYAYYPIGNGKRGQWLLIANQDFVRTFFDNEGIRGDVRTFMHELGHNFNLWHGGFNDKNNYNPNYKSVMNYYYQLFERGELEMKYSLDKETIDNGQKIFDDWGNLNLKSGNIGYGSGYNADIKEDDYNGVSELTEEEAVKNGLLGKVGDGNVAELSPIRIAAHTADQKFYLQVLNYGNQKVTYQLSVNGHDIAQSFNKEVTVAASKKRVEYSVVEVPINDLPEAGEYELTCTLFYQGKVQVVRTIPITVYDFNEEELSTIKEQIQDGTLSENVPREALEQFATLTGAKIPMQRKTITAIITLTVIAVVAAVAATFIVRKIKKRH